MTINADTPRTYQIDEATFVKLRLPNGSELTSHALTADGEIRFDVYAAQSDSHHYGMTEHDAVQFIRVQGNTAAPALAVVENMANASRSMLIAAQHIAAHATALADCGREYLTRETWTDRDATTINDYVKSED